MDYDPIGGTRKINWDPSEQVIEEEPAPALLVVPKPVPVAPRATGTAQVTVIKPKITRNRIGNGHKKQKVRDLHDSERTFLRSTFQAKNGQIEDDFCVDLKYGNGSATGMDADVAIFQITGFMSFLHREVAQNRLVLQDLQAYCNWMHTRYADLWEQWNRPAFVNIRRVNAENRTAGRPLASIPRTQSPTVFTPASSPAFKPFARRGVFHRNAA
jgi:hypothetical protein